MPAAFKSLVPILVVCLVLAAVGGWIFWRYLDTYHFAAVRDGALYRDGVRSLHQFRLAVEKSRVKTVVSLVDDSEIGQPPFTDESAYCQSNGINLVRIPVVLGGWPTDDQVKKFLAIANDPRQQPVMVHCAQGVRRTGMMSAAYQLSVLHWDKAQARAAILSFGHSQRTIGDVQRFIEVYNPTEQRMMVELPRSNE